MARGQADRVQNECVRSNGIVRSRVVSGRRSNNLERDAIGASLVVAAMVVPLVRPTGRVWQTMFAEDGAIYFQQVHDHGVLAALFRGYAGYLQLPPRILGALST